MAKALMVKNPSKKILAKFSNPCGNGCLPTCVFKGVKRNSDQPILRQESADKLFKYEIFIVSRQTSVNLNYLYRVRHIYTQVVDLSGYQNNSSSKQPSQYKTILVLLTQRYWIHTHSFSDAN